MGIYLNPGNDSYRELLNSKVVVDKTLLIDKMNEILNTKSKNICISRPRRFGKSTDAEMLAAYYSKGCDSHTLFDAMNIATTENYEKHLNQHYVIHLNMQDFLSISTDIQNLMENINRKVIKELKRDFAEYCDETYLSEVLSEIFAYVHESFVFIIDEWDCVFRVFKNDTEAQKRYLDFLRNLLKDKPYVEMCYMTGILPIKKYGTHSALNMFKEVSMVEPLSYSAFMGFTEKEVKKLCLDFNVDYNTMREWYDGYRLKDGIAVYSPRSVVSAIEERTFNNYWSQTETYESLKEYIDLNLEGLKDLIIALIAGEKKSINIRTFKNDMTTFSSKDDVCTLLIHLGYLGYDSEEGKVYIPNNEVKNTFIDSISESSWKVVSNMFKNANDLLEATWNCDEEKVAKYIQESHYETSILQYNDENALAYTISLAYITAKEHYTMIRELLSDKGFADIAFIPKKDKPAMIIELKWNQNADTGIKQIKEKHYPKALEEYQENLLLVSINYDKTSKVHECRIEKLND